MSKPAIIGAIAIAVASAMLLAGCAASDLSPKPPKKTDASTSGPAPGGAATPVPSADPGSLSRATTQIVVRPELLQFKDKDGIELGTLSYDTTADEFVDLFTDLMGVAPAVTDTPGGHESHPVTHYNWNGFELQDDHEREGVRIDMNLSVMFTEPELGARRIVVSTIQGFKPGDDLHWLARYMDEPFYEGAEFNQIQAEHGPPIGEQAGYSTYSNSNSVTGQNHFTDGRTVIFAPWNFGIGHV